MSAWFICELLVFKYLRGKVWLVDLGKYLQGLLHPCRVSILNNDFVVLGKGKVENHDALHDFEFKLGDLHAIIPFWGSQDKDSMDKSQIAKHRWREGIRRVIQEIQYLRKGTPLSIPSQGLKHMTNLPIDTLQFKERKEKIKKMVMVSQKLRTQDRAGLGLSLRFSPDGTHLLASDMRYDMQWRNTPKTAKKKSPT